MNTAKISDPQQTPYGPDLVLLTHLTQKLEILKCDTHFY